jgi:hypothetical protein
MRPWALACLPAWLAIACSSLAPTLPVQVADITFAERITQTFFDSKNDDEAYELFHFLIGPQATQVLEKLQPNTALAAASGDLEAHGHLVLTARLDPFDSKSYTVQGFGHFFVLTTLPDSKERLFDADFSIGNGDRHALSELESRKQVILPVIHDIQLHPAVLFGRTKVDESGHCSIPIDTKERAVGAVSCVAGGIGTPHRARYYVRVHLEELVAGEVFAVDNERSHEVFRDDDGERKIFGCLRLEPAKALRVLDLRGRDFAGELPTPPHHEADSAAYDGWNVPDVCNATAARSK